MIKEKIVTFVSKNGQEKIVTFVTKNHHGLDGGKIPEIVTCVQKDGLEKLRI